MNGASDIWLADVEGFLGEGRLGLRLEKGEF